MNGNESSILVCCIVIRIAIIAGNLRKKADYIEKEKQKMNIIEIVKRKSVPEPWSEG